MQTIIIDDEQPAINILSNFVKKIPFLNLNLATTNAFEALEILNTQKIDLLFLDIEMPDITGIELLHSLEQKPLVIFTTAYEQYALQGYEMDVLDYLVKPIRFERFLKAANKAQSRFQNNSNITSHIFEDYVIIKSNYKNIKIPFSEILYIEGLKDYVKIYTEQEMFLTRLNLKGISQKIPSNLFIRIHRSYIVNLDKITSFQKNEINIKKTNLPIGESYRDNIINKLK